MVQKNVVPKHLGMKKNTTNRKNGSPRKNMAENKGGVKLCFPLELTPLHAQTNGSVGKGRKFSRGDKLKRFEFWVLNREEKVFFRSDRDFSPLY